MLLLSSIFYSDIEQLLQRLLRSLLKRKHTCWKVCQANCLRLKMTIFLTLYLDQRVARKTVLQCSWGQLMHQKITFSKLFPDDFCKRLFLPDLQSSISGESFLQVKDSDSAQILNINRIQIWIWIFWRPNVNMNTKLIQIAPKNYNTWITTLHILGLNMNTNVIWKAPNNLMFKYI